MLTSGSQFQFGLITDEWCDEMNRKGNNKKAEINNGD